VIALSFLKRNKVKLLGRKITIKPMAAEEGLKTVIELSRMLYDAVPNLRLLADRQRSVRLLALFSLLKNTPYLPDTIFHVVNLGTGIPLIQLREEATLKEILAALSVIIRVNNWDDLWVAAASLQIVDEPSMINWLMARIPDLRT